MSKHRYIKNEKEKRKEKITFLQDMNIDWGKYALYL